jgi:hypothetical protein
MRYDGVYRVRTRCPELSMHVYCLNRRRGYNTAGASSRAFAMFGHFDNSIRLVRSFIPSNAI